MAFRCGFFTSINGDRKYGANEMMNPIKGIVSEGIVADDVYSDGLQVQALDGLNIIVKKGNGLFFGKWCENDSDMSFTVPLPHVTLNRIDSIVIKIDTTDEVRRGSIEYKQGGDTAPELIRNERVKEFRLANITVRPNTEIITQADIEDTRPTSECGFVTNLLQNSDITATYSQWQSQYDEWFEKSQNNFNETKIANQKDFDDWFSNVRETLSSSTLLRSFTTRYVTTEQDEATIPIGIPEYKSVLDVLQVYVSGLLCFEGTDYVIDNYNTITLTNSVDKGTEIHFVVYKSMDGTGIDKFILDVDELIERQNTIEENFSNVETSFNTFKNGINTQFDSYKTTTDSQINTLDTKLTNTTLKANEAELDIVTLQSEVVNLKKDPTALWTGANTMGDGVTITPTKKLSACKNGWILIWCGYNTTDNIATNTRFNSIVVPKTLLASIPGNYMPFYCNLAHNVYNSGNVEYNAKMVQIWDDKITGFAGNVATDIGKGFCLKQVIEF